MTRPLPLGFSFAGVRCGLKNKRNDVGILLSDRPARAAGVFTTNRVRAACVDLCREHLAGGSLRAVVVNSGNANCCTGDQGARDARRTAEIAAEALGLSATDIAVSSTGVIGHLLDMAKLERGVRAAAEALGPDPNPFKEAILTTDLVEKEAFSAVRGTGAVVYGVAKGSGMIAPNMATMLVYLATDADADGLDLAGLVARVADRTFNRMSVDTDTSTNDSCLVLANGASGERPTESALEEALHAVMLSLAKQVASDGEGATKLIEVTVEGSADPVRIARSIADSPLVKTAMFGCDPNWGRIMMAAGKAGVDFDPSVARLTVRAGEGEFVLFENGGPAAFDAKEVSTALKADTVIIDLALGPGARETVYTCDLGYGYVRINAEYHT